MIDRGPLLPRTTGEREDVRTTVEAARAVLTISVRILSIHPPFARIVGWMVSHLSHSHYYCYAETYRSRATGPPTVKNGTGSRRCQQAPRRRATNIVQNIPPGVGHASRSVSKPRSSRSGEELSSQEGSKESFNHRSID